MGFFDIIDIVDIYHVQLAALPVASALYGFDFDDELIFGNMQARNTDMRGKALKVCMHTLMTSRTPTHTHAHQHAYTRAHTLTYTHMS